MLGVLGSPNFHANVPVDPVCKVFHFRSVCTSKFVKNRLKMLLIPFKECTVVARSIENKYLFIYYSPQQVLKGL